MTKDEQIKKLEEENEKLKQTNANLTVMVNRYRAAAQSVQNVLALVETQR